MSLQTSYLFDDYLIDLESNRIHKDNKSVSIEPRVMDVLTLLLENAGRLVYREELIKGAWGEQSIGYGSLNRNIAAIRKILDEDNQNGSCIKTIPKKGYLFQGEIKKVARQAPLLESKKDSRATPPSQKIIHIDRPEPFKPQNKNQQRYFALSFILVVAIFSQLVSVADKDPNAQGTNHRAMIATPNTPTSQTKMHQDRTPQTQRNQTQKHHTLQIQQKITLAPSNSEKAFCLDGVDDYLEVSQQSPLNIGYSDFSISAWVKTASLTTAVIVDNRSEQRTGDVRGFNLHLYQGRLGMQLADGKGDWVCKSNPMTSSCTNYYSSGFISDNDWRFVSVTVDRDNKQGIRFFLDGEFVDSADPTIRKGSLTTKSPLRIGSRSSSVSGLFPGLIGEVKIYNYLITAEQIRADYTQGVGRSCN